MFLTLGKHGKPESLFRFLCGFPVKVAIEYDPLGPYLNLLMGSVCHPVGEVSDSVLTLLGTWLYYLKLYGLLLTTLCLSFLTCDLGLIATFYLKWCYSKHTSQQESSWEENHSLKIKTRMMPPMAYPNLITTRAFCCLTSPSIPYHLYLGLCGSRIRGWLYFKIMHLNSIFLLICSLIGSIL